MMPIDPVCGQEIDEEAVQQSAAESSVYQGATYYFCCPYCRKQFEQDPERYLPPEAEGRRP